MIGPTNEQTHKHQNKQGFLLYINRFVLLIFETFKRFYHCQLNPTMSSVMQCTAIHTESLTDGVTTILEGSNDLKLYSLEVCFYQTYKFVILGEYIWQKRTKNHRLKPKTIVLKRSLLSNIFYLG